MLSKDIMLDKAASKRGKKRAHMEERRQEYKEGLVDVANLSPAELQARLVLQAEKVRRARKQKARMEKNKAAHALIEAEQNRDDRCVCSDGWAGSVVGEYTENDSICFSLQLPPIEMNCGTKLQNSR